MLITCMPGQALETRVPLLNYILNQNFNQIQTVTAGHSDDCVRQVFRTLCNFYLPPCGNSTHPVPPSSICPEECQMVQDKCQLTWDAVMLFLTLDPIIYCNDTSQLLFPVPHCCTDAGLGLCLVLSLTVTIHYTFPNNAGIAGNRQEEGTSQQTPLAWIVGGVVAFILLAAAVVVGVVLLMRILPQRYKLKRIEEMQLDILAM